MVLVGATVYIYDELASFEFCFFLLFLNPDVILSFIIERRLTMNSPDCIVGTVSCIAQWHKHYWK